MTSQSGEWVKVVRLSDCEDCPLCDEPICPKCTIHYWDCSCPGLYEDNLEYECFDWEMYAREQCR